MSRTTLYTVFERNWGDKADRKVGMYASELKAKQRMNNSNNWAIRRACDEMIMLRGPKRGHGASRYSELVNRVQTGFFYIKTHTTDD